MIDADVHPPGILREVVHPVRDYLAQRVVDKVVHADGDRLALGVPLATGVLVVADELLLLRVDGDHGCAPRLERVDPVVEILELIVAVRVRRPLQRLLRRLEAVPARVQELPNFLRADGVPLRPQFLGEAPGTLRRPPQRGLGIAPGHGFDQRFQRLHDLGL